MLNSNNITPPPYKLKSERIAWIDVSRGLAFLMVIYSHLPQNDHSVMRFFSPIFLTTFFFVSGYLYKSGTKFSVILEQRLRTLLIPFIILGLIMIGLSQILSFNDKGNVWEDIKGLLLQNGDNQILWFIAALFVYSLLFYFIDYFCKSIKSLLIVSTALFIVNCFTLHYFELKSSWHIYAFGFACFYMALGRAYKEYETVIDSKIKNWYLLIALIVYIGFIFISDKEINFNGSNSIIDAMFLTLLGLFIIVTVSKKFFHNSRLLLFVGANSLFYFAFHGKVYSLILTVGEKISYETVHSDNLSIKLIIAFSIVLLDAIILIPPTLFTNKYIPQILGKKFKLWKTHQH